MYYLFFVCFGSDCCFTYVVSVGCCLVFVLCLLSDACYLLCCLLLVVVMFLCLCCFGDCLILWNAYFGIVCFVFSWLVSFLVWCLALLFVDVCLHLMLFVCALWMRCDFICLLW